MISTKIIAEVSANHANSLDIAKALVTEASKASAHFVKFQLYSAYSDIVKLPGINYPELISKQISRDSELISQFSVPLDWLSILYSHSQSLNINLIYSCSDIELLPLAKQYSSVSTLKIASCDATNLRLLYEASKLFDDLIISTGALSLADMKDLVLFLEKYCGFKGTYSFLYCISKYPCNSTDIHLKTIEYLRSELCTPIGYSDHLPGITGCITSLQYFPSYIEKHFQLPNYDTVDSCVSCTPHELSQLVDALAFSDRIDPDISNERTNVMYLRSPYNSRQINSLESIDFVRPGLGLNLHDSIQAVMQDNLDAKMINSNWPSND